MSGIPLVGRDEATGEVAGVCEVLQEHCDEVPILTLTLLTGLAGLFGRPANTLRIPIDEIIGAAPPPG